MGRAFRALLCAFALVGPATAQDSTAVRRIGVLTLGVPSASPYMDAFRRGLLDHGYVERKNIVVEFRHAEGEIARLPSLARELVALKVGVIVTESAPAALAATRASKTTPVVMAAGPSPVSLGLAESLSRPGGNVTGVSLSGAARTAKQLQLVKEALPGTETIAVIYNAGRPGVGVEVKEARDTAASLGVTLHLVPVRGPADLDGAFESIAKQRPGALVTIGDGMLLGNSRRIAEFAVQNRLPAVFPEREFAEVGGLMAYGPDISHNFLRAAALVDKILKGTKPADIPIELPRKWGLVINIKSARALGLSLPPSVMARADEVLQ